MAFARKKNNHTPVGDSKCGERPILTAEALDYLGKPSFRGVMRTAHGINNDVCEIYLN
jgi:hypothetical protein